MLSMPNTKRLNIIIPTEEAEELQREADRQRRTITSLIRGWIAQAAEKSAA